MISLPIISILSCYAYIIFIVLKYGVPVSISETYYILPSKWDWLFAAWTVMTAAPFGIYWFTIAPDNLKWIPATVAVAMLMIGVACCYKSGPKRGEGYVPNIMKGNDPDAPQPHYYGESKPSLWFRFECLLADLKTKFSAKEFFRYGAAHFIHYVNSLIAIILSTVYICITCGAQAIACTVISYIIFIIIGLKVDGVYNADYSADVDNKAWIFFMEVICFTNLFVFIW